MTTYQRMKAVLNHRVGKPTITQEEMKAAFSNWGVEVTRATLSQLEGRVSDEGTRRVLAEIGIPQCIGEWVNFVYLEDDEEFLETVTEFHNKHNKQKPEDKFVREAGSLFILGSGNGIILLQGETGEVYSWRDSDGLKKICSNLESFIGFVYLIQVAMNTMEESERAGEPVMAGKIAKLLVDGFWEQDGKFSPQKEAYWLQTILYTFRRMGFYAAIPKELRLSSW